MRWLAAWLVLLVVIPTSAAADELRPASISFEQQDDTRWTLAWKLPLGPASTGQLTVPDLPGNCSLVGEPNQRRARLALIGEADVQCTGDTAGGTIGLPGLYGNSDAMLRVAPLGRPVQAYRLTADQPNATIAARPATGQVFRSYFVFGVEHILMGWDHLLFVIALLLLVRRGWDVVKAATAFTIAHSITLAGSSLGVVGLPQRPVEALIALSIVFLAVEITHSAKGRSGWTQRLPWLVAFLFGLLHGFGFAGALRELGLPEGEVPMALVAFNLGVEAGQLLVIGAVIALLALIARFSPKAEHPAVRLATYAIGIIGSYWLIDRTLF